MGWLEMGALTGLKLMGAGGARHPPTRSFVGNFLLLSDFLDLNVYFWKILRRNDAQKHGMDLILIQSVAEWLRRQSHELDVSERS